MDGGWCGAATTTLVCVWPRSLMLGFCLAQLILAQLLDVGDTFLVEEYTYSHILESVAEPKGYVPIGAQPRPMVYIPVIGAVPQP